MKQFSILIILMTTGCLSFGQNAPVIEKSAPKSNNTLPSAGALGSNSGVNPTGNPGTIINYSSNSSAANTPLAPNPNIEPGVFLTSSPQGTVIVSSVDNGTTVQQQTSVVTASGTVTTEVADKPVVAAVNEPVAVKTEPVKVAESVKAKEPKITPVGKTAVATVKDSRNRTVTYTPVIGNFVPEKIINKIKEKYGPSVYDIVAVRTTGNNKAAYLVRLVEDGKFKKELFYDEP